VNQSTTRPIVEVAVGVLIQNHTVLLGQRPHGKPYAGYWEFPGGKVEPGETIFLALRRELQEEINIVIEDANEFMVLEHDYPHAYVRLHICLVRQWQGNPQGMEEQQLAWLSLDDSQSSLEPLLPATIPIMEKLRGMSL
jgi:8-oxo-dGTP diphosphatase